MNLISFLGLSHLNHLACRFTDQNDSCDHVIVMSVWMLTPLKLYISFHCQSLFSNSGHRQRKKAHGYLRKTIQKLCVRFWFVQGQQEGETWQEVQREDEVTSRASEMSGTGSEHKCVGRSEAAARYTWISLQSSTLKTLISKVLYKYLMVSSSQIYFQKVLIVRAAFINNLHQKWRNGKVINNAHW